MTAAIGHGGRARRRELTRYHRRMDADGLARVAVPDAKADGAAAGESPFKAVNCAINRRKRRPPGRWARLGIPHAQRWTAAARVAGDGACRWRARSPRRRVRWVTPRWAVARRRRRQRAGPLGLRFQVIESHEERCAPLVWGTAVVRDSYPLIMDNIIIMLAPRDVIRSPRRDRPYRSATPPCGSRARSGPCRSRPAPGAPSAPGTGPCSRPSARWVASLVSGRTRRARIQALSVSGRGSASSPPTTPGSLARPSARPPAPTAPAQRARAHLLAERVPLLVAVRAIRIEEAIHQRRAGFPSR